jgi:peptidoglycan/xylan/chitin deacetylase (PgdA/CDA1 family)
MTPKGPEYLLRFDDLCPTMARSPWEQYERVLHEFDVKPILAVVPENRDPGLELELADAGFWERIGAWEAAGAAIGLHGYGHVCASHGRSLIPMHTQTEFAGVAAETQREWIHTGVELLRGHGLRPKLFVAPRHGFDRNTLAALQAEGIEYLSDGLMRVPVARGGVVWIPQQLWEPVERPAGLWTICLHSNTAGDESAARLRAFLVRNRERVTSFDRVIAEYPVRPLGLLERWYEEVAMIRLRILRGRRVR